MIQHKNDVDLHFNKNNLSPKSQNHANEITIFYKALYLSLIHISEPTRPY